MDVTQSTDITSSYKENNGKMPGTNVLKQNKNNTGNNLDNILMQNTNNNIYKSAIYTEDYLQNLNSWLTPTKGVPDITSGR